LKFSSGILFIAALALSSCRTTTFYLVRHAEKAENGNDPSLSVAGQARAIALKDLLLPKKIKNIYVTNYQRTQQTATPLAKALGVRMTIIPASNTSSLIDSLQIKKGSQSTLIVGHSNSVPDIIDILMKTPQQISISENDFDNIYTVSIKKRFKIKRKLVVGEYGTKTTE
jgi:broad specificity phosphatase PhoE